MQSTLRSANLRKTCLYKKVGILWFRRKGENVCFSYSSRLSLNFDERRCFRGFGWVWGIKQQDSASKNWSICTIWWKSGCYINNSWTIRFWSCFLRKIFLHSLITLKNAPFLKGEFEDPLVKEAVDVIKETESESQTFVMEFKAKSSGTYAFCLDNRASRFLSKNVQVINKFLTPYSMGRISSSILYSGEVWCSFHGRK